MPIRNMPRKSLRNLAIVVLCILGSSLYLIQHDFFESIFVFSRAHETAQLDEIFTLLMVVGLFGYALTWHRVRKQSQEIQRRRHAEQRALYLAYHDQLTGLLNRHALNDRFEGTCAPDEEDRVVLALMDLKGFKHINDLYGHAAGDSLLQHVAAQLNACFPEPDSVYRLAGDEFVVVWTSRDPEHKIRQRLEQAIQATARNLLLGDVRISACTYFGVALFPEQGIELSSLLRRADIALYQAKKEAQAGVRFYSPALDSPIEEQANIEGAIRRGLAQQGFVPYFQPLIELASGRVLGFEVLARLHDPHLGQVPPSKFIPVAERTGLIQAISGSILQQAARIAVQSLPAHTYIAFNISPLELRDPDLLERILQTLQDTGLPCARLELEITESVLIDSGIDANGLFERLHAEGISIAIDDFGTGYSSLARLSRFPFDKIKIDREFIRLLGQDERNERVVEAMLGLCHGLNSIVLAEGVEEPAQAEWLKSRGVEQAQGYLYSRPLPIEALKNLLVGQSCLAPLTKHQANDFGHPLDDA